MQNPSYLFQHEQVQMFRRTKLLEDHTEALYSKHIPKSEIMCEDYTMAYDQIHLVIVRIMSWCNTLPSNDSPANRRASR